MHTTLYALDKELFESSYLNMPRDLLIAEWNAMVKRGMRLNGKVAEIIEELELDSLITEGDRLILPKAASRVILELCKVDCVISEYEIQATDNFFADWAANPPQLEGISDRLLTAWQLFNKVVDISVLYRQHLPWWFREATVTSCAYSGLLTPSEAKLIQVAHEDLEHLLIVDLTSQLEKADLQGLLRIIDNAAISDQWVLGWEYGT